MSIVPLPSRRTLAAQAATLAPLVPDYPVPFAVLKLDDLVPIAAGGERRVYQHPSEPTLLVKVVDAETRRQYMQTRPFRRWHKRFQREGAYRNHIAEIAEYTAAQNVAAGRWKVPMARVLGLTQTSLGLGLLVEKISDGHGGLAPTVEQIVREQGLDAELARQLDFFFDSLADHHIILNDVSARNIVVGENADGEPGMYLIDGFGSKQAIPVYAVSKTLNRRRIQRKYKALMEKLQANARKRKLELE